MSSPDSVTYEVQAQADGSSTWLTLRVLPPRIPTADELLAILEKARSVRRRLHGLPPIVRFRVVKVERFILSVEDIVPHPVGRT